MKGDNQIIELSDYSNTGQVRVYDIEAVSLPIVYNKYGDHDPDGLMYVLKQDSERIQRKAKKLFDQPIPQPYEEVRPLVIRANVGDTIQINFENKLNRRASIHVQGLSYHVLTSDGANVGFNPDTTTVFAAMFGRRIKRGFICFRIWPIPEATRKERMCMACSVQSSWRRQVQHGRIRSRESP